MLKTVLLVICYFVQAGLAAQPPFDNWPAGRSPEEIGLKVANRFVITSYSIHYTKLYDT